MDEIQLRTLLSSVADSRLEQIHLFDEIDSTNAEAIRRIKSGQKGAFLVVSDAQSNGRGRRGRSWLSSANAGLYMSLALPLHSSVSNLQALSLVTALAVYGGITNHYDAELQLKWPNDVLAGNKKLAGILLEQQQSDGMAVMVFGIGVNISIPEEIRNQIERPVSDLSTASGVNVDIQLLCAGVINALIDKVDVFCLEGFAQFQPEWNVLDRYRGDDIVIENGETRTIGKSLGVNGDGCLVLQTLAGELTVTAGEIFPSLKPVSQE